MDTDMSLGKQAKILSKNQVEAMVQYLGARRNGLRNQVILMLSVKAGLRAKEIANLKWSMILTAEGLVGDAIHLTDSASKGRSGRIVPLNKHLKLLLKDLYEARLHVGTVSEFVITSERSKRVSAQTIVNMFQGWYRDVGFQGCSSHSGRRTFITNAARKISTVGGSLRDVQDLAGHSTLQTTQRYIDSSAESKIKIVNLV